MRCCDSIGRKSVKWIIALGVLLFFTVSSGRGASEEVEKSSENLNEGHAFEKLDPNKVTTEWNNSYLFSSKEDASKKLESLKQKSEEMNKTFRPGFENLSGPVLLNFLETEKKFSRSVSILYIYAYTQLSKNVNDPSFASLLEDVQGLITEHEKTNAFVPVKLTSLNKEEWDRLFSEEPKLETYRPYLEANYMRFAEHRPINESQAVYLAEIENQRMKLETKLFLRSQITLLWQEILLLTMEKHILSIPSPIILCFQQTRIGRKEKGVTSRDFST
jgi:oligoendopeptidase F